MQRNLPLVLLVSVVAFISCTEKKNIAVETDFQQYLLSTDSIGLKNVQDEMIFWKKKNEASPDPSYESKIAGTYSHRFAITGRVEDLEIADSIYHHVLALDSNRSGTYQALAVNCISRHEFRQAKKYVQKALSIGDNKSSSLFILFDVNMELGDYGGAKNILSKFENKNAFAFLARQAKLDDEEGHLDLAILKMEQGLARIKDDLSLYCWTLSNLGDMYGHANRIEDAYQAYLNVLKKKPSHDFALKGIAWIALSHDHNTSLAKRIATSLLKKKETPDMHLLLAKIADEERDIAEKNKELQIFAHQASLPKYGNMYNKYLALLEAEDFRNPTKTVDIAEIEIKNRPTPQSYDLLAWGYFQKGDKEKALDVVQRNVEGKTFEPEALYHLGLIYKGVDPKKSYNYLSQAKECSFELGPAIKGKIQNAME